jgi:hypothetical protein
MMCRFSLGLLLRFLMLNLLAGDFIPAPQRFQQEVARHFDLRDGLPHGPVQLLDVSSRSEARVFVAGHWFERGENRWSENAALAPKTKNEFVFADAADVPVHAPVAWAEVKQLVRYGRSNYLAMALAPALVLEGHVLNLGWSNRARVNQIVVGADGRLIVASDAGLFRQSDADWARIDVSDGLGRLWAARDVLGAALDSRGQLWFATKAGVGCDTPQGWRFYEGKDGLPWNDFTCVVAGPGGGVWFGTHLGAIRFDGQEWQYRQGPLWLPHDDVKQILAGADGRTWFATADGVGLIERRTMTLAQKAEFYESEIEHYVKRTPYGYVAEAPLRKRADKSSAAPQDSDNDGLWTAMYGAGECFGYAATKDPVLKQRAQKAFEALRFLQKVTQGGPHSPPKGFVARSIRPVDWPDPNAGGLERDREAQKHDHLWKVYEPRWPKSADGQWFWKSDTSSDELDGHYFFYPLYFDYCADSAAEKDRVREVVRDLTDHLLTHGFSLIDHDGRPTRWGIYGPQSLNRDPIWWPERGLKSLSLLSYLAVAAHVTGEPKYTSASRDLIEQQGYAHNAMFAKVQHGPGSGNQSDDEMAFMSYYNLLRYTRDETLQRMIRYSFFSYWVNEAPEMNPFFNFAYAGVNLDGTAATPWMTVSLKPWNGWHHDAMATLYGFPLDRLNWPHQNSQRLDIVPLPRVRSGDLDEPDRPVRGYRVNGKVLPVENRHFNHWNTDPWELDYAGDGNELAAGTVFLLPYYLGLYHGFIERPH